MHATQLHFVSMMIFQLLESSRALILLPAKEKAKAKAKAKAKESGKTGGGSEIISGKTNGEATTGGRCP